MTILIVALIFLIVLLMFTNDVLDSALGLPYGVFDVPVGIIDVLERKLVVSI